MLRIQLEAAAAATREEKRKGEAAVEAAEARFAAREALLKDDWDRCGSTSRSANNHAMQAQEPVLGQIHCMVLANQQQQDDLVCM